MILCPACRSSRVRRGRECCKGIDRRSGAIIRKCVMYACLDCPRVEVVGFSVDGVRPGATLRVPAMWLERKAVRT